MRDRTEWTETVDAGWNDTVGTDADELVRVLEAHRAAHGDEPWSSDRPDLYGDGHAAEQILDVLARHATFSPF
jgi:UDP-N-acetylglucosamine 2-epimerase (non-hydrolysing)